MRKVIFDPVENHAIALIEGFEFPWACGPPIGMKAHFIGPIDSK